MNAVKFKEGISINTRAYLMGNDNPEKFRSLLQKCREFEQIIISENRIEFAIDERCEKPSAFLWKYLERQNRTPLSLHKQFECFSEFPEFSLACLLESGQSMLDHVKSLSVDQTEDNKFHFCISGSISLDDLRKECEYQISHPNTDKRRTE